MAIDDIVFNEGEPRDFIVEIPLGSLNAPVDILVETDGTLIMSELPEKDSIFINLD